MNFNTPSLTVIIVTYNPRSDLLAWGLDSLEKQTLPKEQFEVIVVDNNSSPPLQPSHLLHGRSLHLRLVHETEQGIMHARRAGILAATSPLLVFVDDDNHLAPDYLQEALRIAGEHPDIGAYGGIARGVFEEQLQPWQDALLRHLGVRDFGTEPITATDPCWGPWEPIGAGMAVRCDVALAFVARMQQQPEIAKLGRSGKFLMSGDDALLARTAYQLGFACSYQPTLILQHYMKKGRLLFRSICKTIEGHGRSEVLLMKIEGKAEFRPRMPTNIFLLIASLVYRVLSLGPKIGYIEWHWDLGYYRQHREMCHGT